MERLILNEPPRARGWAEERQIWMSLRLILPLPELPHSFDSLAGCSRSSFELAQ